MTDAPAEKSFVERWDRYWFGEEATQDYLCLQIAGFEFQELDAAGKPLEYERLLQLFPEIRYFAIDYGPPHTWEKHRQHPRPMPPALVQAIGRLPKLEYLISKELGSFDDAWVESLPEPSPLRQFRVREPQLTSSGACLLLKKCPKLDSLALPATAFQTELVNKLNTEDLRFQARGFINDLEIRIEDSRSSRVNGLPPDLLRLEAPHKLQLQPTWEVKRIDNPANLEPNTLPDFSWRGYQATMFKAEGSGNLEFAALPKLKELWLDRVSKVTVHDCAQLDRLCIFFCDQIDLHDLPLVKSLLISDCGKLKISDCPLLEEIGDGYMVEELTLQRLPQVRSLYFGGKSLQLDEVPNLESISIYNATSQQLKELQKLPALRNLTLQYSGSIGTIPYEPGLLLLLRDLPALERVSLVGIVPFDNDYELLRDLRQLTKLRVLRMERVMNFENFPQDRELVALLPPNLEILTTRDATNPEQLAKILQQAFPNIVYHEPGYRGHTTVDPKRLRYYSLPFEVQDTPTAEALRPYAVQAAGEKIPSGTAP